MKIKLLVSLSVLRNLKTNNCYSFMAVKNWQSENALVFVVKLSHTKKRMKMSRGLPHSPRATTPAELWKWFNTVS